MNKEIIKQQLIEKIADKTVIAAAFYTFNFQPAFFENYVLPVLVPTLEFKNSRLYNAILWRKTTLPKVVVYYDDSIQKMSDSSAPLQDYELCPVRIERFFHPKASFILVQNKENERSLIVVLGSNNLTRAGWCDNIEVATIIEIEENGNYSTSFIKELEIFVAQNFERFGDKGNVENEILSFLNQIKTNQTETSTAFYQSITTSFKDFLKQQIFDIDEITEIEIFSPFFQKDIQSKNTTINWLQSQTAASIKCLIPFKHDIEIQLEKPVFEAYQNHGVIWSDFAKDDDLKVRYNHSKVYRFKGKKQNYTILGSVNFTQNAWIGFEQNGNIETAILFKDEKKWLPFLKKIKVQKEWLFLEENTQKEEETNNFFRKSPNIEFTINWQNNELIVEVINSIDKKNLSLDLVDLNEGLTKSKTFPLTKIAIRALARNPIIKVIEATSEQDYDHYYYPHQIGIAQRPFLEKFSFRDMRKLWQLLGEEVIDEAILRTIERLVNKYEKADGTIDEALINEGVINKMAAHIDSLVQLEKDLFQPNVTLERLRDYLVMDVLSSIPYYKRVFILEDESLNKGFVWILLQIIKMRFYNKKKHPLWKDLKPELVPIIETLEVEIAEIEKELEMEDKSAHLDWAKKQLINA